MSKRYKGNLGRLNWRLGVYKGTMMRRIEKAVNITLADSAFAMLNVINTSGTGWVGKGPQAFGEGRVDYGTMRSAVSYDYKVTAFGVIGQVGWGINGHDALPYFLEQENGFMNPWTGALVPPMHALLTARTVAFNRIDRELRKALKG